MARYDYDLRGVDFKAPRKGTRRRRNRFNKTYSRWLFPAMVVLTSLGIIVVGIR